VPEDDTRFIRVSPTLDAYWRAIILFGRNSASYKFALGKVLLDLASGGTKTISLEELAPSFADAICAHLKDSSRQGTAARSRFLDACRKANAGGLDRQSLIDTTVQYGFNNVLDAFHIVGSGPVSKRFFHVSDQKKASITLSDDLMLIAGSRQAENLGPEIEARWKLVETAWSLGISPRLLVVETDPSGEVIWVPSSARDRIDITSSREALDGYQKGICFYCPQEVSLVPGSDQLADVDHFIPLHLRQHFGGAINLNGVWNLVLACRACNRGEGGKRDRLAAGRYLETLFHRNEYLINSHHPLRETLIAQTGKTTSKRRETLKSAYRFAAEHLGLILAQAWSPAERRQVDL